MEKQKLYTFGYSLFKNGEEIDFDKLFSSLLELGITHLVDVRTVPYSKQYPCCNIQNMKSLCVCRGIYYMHMPEIGAKAESSQDVFSKAGDIFYDDIFPISKSKRPEKEELLATDEIVDFKKMRNNDAFNNGIMRIKNAYEKGFKLVLMCSEKNPMDCHRFFLISRAIEEKIDVDVYHFVQDEKRNVVLASNYMVKQQLKEYVFKRTEIIKLNVLNSSLFEEAKINVYNGETTECKIFDFCDRYWNLMHGWKRFSNNNIMKYD